MSELPERKTKAAEEAVLCGRDVLDLSIGTGQDSYEMESGLLGELLSAVQSALYALDERWASNPKKPPSSVAQDNTVMVTALYRSPFGIRLQSKHCSDLFGVTPATAAMRRLAELMAEVSEKASFQAKLRAVSPRAVGQFRELLEVILRGNASLALEWAAPNGEKVSAELTAETLPGALELIKQTKESKTVMKIKGRLTKVDSKRSTFQLESEDGRRFTGRISAAAKSDASKIDYAGGPAMVEALLEEAAILSVTTGREIASYTLLEVSGRGAGSTESQEDTELREMTRTLEKLYGRMEASLYNESDFANQDNDYSLGAPISKKDYAELIGIMDEIDRRHSSRGGLQGLNLSEIAKIQELLQPEKTIGRLVKLNTSALSPAVSDPFFADEEYPGPHAQAVPPVTADALGKLTRNAYRDLAALAERLGKVIGDLTALLDG